MSFRKFFFSAAAMGALLLPGITVSASAYSLSDPNTLHQSDFTDDACTYDDDCTESGEESAEEEWYLSQEEGSDEDSEDYYCDLYPEDCSDAPEEGGWAI